MVVAVKYIESNESFFLFLFSGKPIMPGVLIIEAMAQTSIILYSCCKPKIAETNPDYYLAKANTEFLHPVFPGDKLILEAKVIRVLDNAGIIDTVAKVDDRLVAKGTLSFGIKKNE